MRAGSNASASRARFGRTPSIHMRVGIDMEERRVAEQRQRLDDAAAGAEHFIALIRDDDAGPCALRGVIDDLVGQIVHVDDGLADAGIAELVEHMIEQRAAGDAHQRLRHLVGQRPHAQAETGGEDHGFGGLDGHFRNFSNRCGARGSYHGDSCARIDLGAIAARHDGYATATEYRVQTSACSRRRAGFFFLSPCFRKLAPIWSPLTQASSQRR